VSTVEITAAIPGVFYRSPGPGKDPYVQEGDRVQAGEVIGLTEIMKQFAEITSTAAGVVTAIHVANGALLTPGMPVASIDVED
jgi:acetyl-CoA carboxylase biotin carboxyl carrier protein